MAIRRRDLLVWAAPAERSVCWSISRGPRQAYRRKISNAAPLPLLDIDCASDSSAAATGLPYAAKLASPGYLAAGSRDAFHTPPPWTPRTTEVREFDLSVVETTLEVATGKPLLRGLTADGSRSAGAATVGDRLRVALGNHRFCPSCSLSRR